MVQYAMNDEGRPLVRSGEVARRRQAAMQSPAPQNQPLDPSMVRELQAQKLAEQRSLDMRRRQLRIKRQSGQLSDQEIQELSQIDADMTRARREKIDAFRLGNRLEGRGPLSPEQAEVSRQRLADQIPAARRSVLKQAGDELDARFDRQVQRQQAGIPDYRPEGMRDMEADRLYQEQAGPTPQQARERFLANTAPSGDRSRDNAARESRVRDMVQQEQIRQARVRREESIASREADAELEAREQRIGIETTEAETAVQMAQNRNRAAQIESMSLDMAAKRLEEYGPRELELAVSEANRRIAENQTAMNLTRDKDSQDYRDTMKKTQELQLKAQLAEQQLRVKQLNREVEMFDEIVSRGEDLPIETMNEVAAMAADIISQTHESKITTDSASAVGAMAGLAEQINRMSPRARQQAADAVVRQMLASTGESDAIVLLEPRVTDSLSSMFGGGVEESINRRKQIAESVKRVVQMSSNPDIKVMVQKRRGGPIEAAYDVILDPTLD